MSQIDYRFMLAIQLTLARSVVVIAVGVAAAAYKLRDLRQTVA